MTTTTTSPSAVSPKVTAAAIGAPVAVAVTTVIAWGVEQTTGVAIPAEVQGAFSIVLAAAGAFAAGYFKKDPARHL